MVWWLVVSGALAGPTGVCPVDDPPALAVVLWDRTNPAPEFFGIQLGRRLGDREYDMREGLLDVLLGVDGLVEPGDRLTVLPYGVDRDQAGVDTLRSQKGDPGDLYSRLKIAFPGGRDPVRAVHTVVPGGDTRQTLARLVADRVTLPLLQECTECRDERGRWGDPSTDRDLAYPTLMTHNALATAYVEHGYDAPCAEPHEVYLVWVSAAPEAQDTEASEHAIATELGSLALKWKLGLDSAYRLEPVRHERHVQAFRVRRAAASDLDLAWTTESGPAKLQAQSWWDGGFESAGTPAWWAPLPAGWTVHSARSELAWVEAGEEQAVDVDVEVDPGALRVARPAALREEILAGLATGERESFEPELRTEVHLLPPAGSLYKWTPVAIVEEATVAPPPIRLQRTPVPIGPLAGIAGVLALVGLVGVRQVSVRVRRRPLAVRVTTGSGDQDLAALRDRSDFATPFELVLDDKSGYRARPASFDVRVSLATFLQADLPLKDREFQRLQGDGWELVDGGLDAHVTTPGEKLSFEVVTRHDAIDFARVSRDEIVVVHAIRVVVSDRTGRYATVDETTFQPVRLKAAPGPAQPEAALELTPAAATRALELRLAGLDDDAWAGARRADVGWLVLQNPVRSRWTPLPVTFRVIEAKALVSGLPAAVHLRGGDLTLAADERRSLVVSIEWPEALRDPSRTAWDVEVRIRLEADDGSGKIAPIPPLVRAFKLRTAGRSRTVILEPGRRRTRVLLQDLDEDRWGFLEDLPATSPDEVMELVRQRTAGPVVTGDRFGERVQLAAGERANVVVIGPGGTPGATGLSRAEATALWFASVAAAAPPVPLPARPRLLLVHVDDGVEAALVDADRRSVRVLAEGRGEETPEDALASLRGCFGRDLSDVDLVVVTGRRAHETDVEAAAVAIGVAPGRVHIVEKRFLDAAACLGARLYALGLCGDFVPGRPVLRGRFLFVLARPNGRVEAIELEPGRWGEVPIFVRARLVRTWMIPTNRAATKPWELDPRRQLAIVNGEPLDLGVSAEPHGEVHFEPSELSFNHGPVHDLHARLRIVTEGRGIVVQTHE